MSSPPTPPVRERELLDAARGGDERAYGRLVEPHRGELHAHCYRMLGSVHDAEDALQEALLRAWRGLGRFEGRSSTRSWLYKIATNTCLDTISAAAEARAADRLRPGHRPPRPGPASRWSSRCGSSPTPTRRSGSRTATPRPRRATSSARASSWRSSPRCSTCRRQQRAVLILREVLGFSARRSPESLETTVAVGQQRAAARRARRVDERLPERSQQATLRVARRRRHARARRRATSTRGSAATSTRSSRC